MIEELIELAKTENFELKVSGFEGQLCFQVGDSNTRGMTDDKFDNDDLFVCDVSNAKNIKMLGFVTITDFITLHKAKK